MKSISSKIDQNRIELLKVIGHSVRIEILERLEGEPRYVNDLSALLDVSQANMSQHLGLLRRVGLVGCSMEGQHRCYFLVDPMVPDLLKVIRKQYKNKLAAPGAGLDTRKKLNSK